MRRLDPLISRCGEGLQIAHHGSHQGADLGGPQVQGVIELLRPDELQHPFDGRGQSLSGPTDALDPRTFRVRRVGPWFIFQSSVRPSTTATGVLSSWLATSMNADLTRLASSRRALASRSCPTRRRRPTIRS